MGRTPSEEFKFSSIGDHRLDFSAMSFSIRQAVVSDAPRLIELMRELAVYEKLEAIFVNDVESLTHWMFGEERCATAHVAEIDSEIVGYAISFQAYSTFLGKPSTWLEDLYVQPDHRKLGIGKALLKNLAQEAVAKGFGRVEWSVLDWNQPAIDFYERIGASILKDWQMCRLAGAALGEFAEA